MALGAGPWEVIRSWEWSPLLGLMSLLKKKTKNTREIFTPSAMWEHSEKTSVSEPGNGTLQDTESVGTLILDFSASRLQKMNACCLHHPI